MKKVLGSEKRMLQKSIGIAYISISNAKRDLAFPRKFRDLADEEKAQKEIELLIENAKRLEKELEKIS